VSLRARNLECVLQPTQMACHLRFLTSLGMTLSVKHSKQFADSVNESFNTYNYLGTERACPLSLTGKEDPFWSGLHKQTLIGGRTKTVEFRYNEYV
jgi:hypothetical protein